MANWYDDNEENKAVLAAYNQVAMKLPPDLLERYKERRQSAIDAQNQPTGMSLEDVTSAQRDRAFISGMNNAANKLGSVGGSVANSGLDETLSALNKVDATEFQAQKAAKQQAFEGEDNANQGIIGLQKTGLEMAKSALDFKNSALLNDPNSSESKYVRTFMKSTYGINTPETASAARLTSFLPLAQKKFEVEQNAVAKKENATASAIERADRAAERGDVQKERDAQRNDNKAIQERERLQRNYNSDLEVKKTKEVLSSVNAITNNSGETAADDIALIFNFMKAQDPGSVVRESEFDMAQAAGSLMEKAKAKFGQMNNGQRLTPQQRAEIKKTATNAYNSAMNRQKVLDNTYMTAAKRRGVPIEDLIFVTPLSASTPTESATKPTQETPSAKTTSWKEF